ncbi:MAG: D-aminoacyl-tRNA deacylase [Candidatus Bathyarchaeia archaeon]
MILIVASKRDVASLNIAEHLASEYPFQKTSETHNETEIQTAAINQKELKLVTLNQELVYAQDLTSSFTNPQLVIFISRHSSESGTPTLSVHTPGNIAEAELGGLPRKVSVSPANAMRNALKALHHLKNELNLNYEVSYEGTHHGPSLDVPTMFAELGSSPAQWNDMKAAKAVAHATIKAALHFGDNHAKAVLGIGGPHYNAKFTKIALENNIAFGHIIPKYAIHRLSEEMLTQCVERTLEPVAYAVLDWKGIKSEDKQPLINMLNKLGLPYEKT